jgi:hypothetical protein
MAIDVIGDRFQSQQHIMIPVTQDAIAQCFQLQGTRSIVLVLSCVLTAIQFDNQLRLRSSEIRNEPAHRHLPAKPESLQLLSSQCAPQGTLGVCGVVAQLACAVSEVVHGFFRPWMKTFSFPGEERKATSTAPLPDPPLRLRRKGGS